MTIAEMKQRKKELGLSYAAISDQADVPLGTVQKILGGYTESPRYETLTALERFFSSFGKNVEIRHCRTSAGWVAEPEHSDWIAEPGHSGRVADSGPACGYAAGSAALPQKCTLKDYYKIPDDRRVELIDGVIYDMASPTSIHQIVGFQLCYLFTRFLEEHGGDCLPMISPLDVQLDCDEFTMLQPDVIIVCDRSKIIRRCVCGAPDFIAEVVSPGSKTLDYKIKLMKYINAGVREYWAVDPGRRKITVFYNDEPDIPAVYSFEDKVPLRIWEGRCVIDFAKIAEQIDFIQD